MLSAILVIYPPELLFHKTDNIYLGCNWICSRMFDLKICAFAEMKHGSQNRSAANTPSLFRTPLTSEMKCIFHNCGAGFGECVRAKADRNPLMPNAHQKFKVDASTCGIRQLNCGMDGISSGGQTQIVVPCNLIRKFVGFMVW